MDIEQIMQILPHRHPFLMVDRVLQNRWKLHTGVKNVTVNEMYFQGHFPGHPSCPGCFNWRRSPRWPGSS